MPRFSKPKRGPKRDKNRIPESDRLHDIRTNESEAERSFRLQRTRDARILRLRVETPKSKGGRLQKQRDRNNLRIKKETPHTKKTRLRKMIDQQYSRLKAETPRKRVARCLDLSDRQSTRLVMETSEESDVRLEDKRERQASQLTLETSEERAVRLEDMLERQASRLAMETSDERAVRLEDKQKRQSCLEASITEEQIIERKAHRSKCYSNKLKSRITLNIARSEIGCEILDSFIDVHSCGSFSYICSVCLAKFWEGEKVKGSSKSSCKFTLCCGSGKVVLTSVAPYPEMLMHLLTTTEERGIAFREKIRAYNCALAFASLGANIDKNLANAKQGVYTFRIQGVVYHSIGQLLPKDNETPKYAQIYIHDGTADAEVENRMQHLGHASLPELRLIQLMLHEYNPYVSFFRQGI